MWVSLAQSISVRKEILKFAIIFITAGLHMSVRTTIVTPTAAYNIVRCGDAGFHAQVEC
jgi:hypothetical protein